MTPAQAQAAALADFLAGRVCNEFTAKTLERGISDRDVERVLNSGSSAGCSYIHERQPRYGFWHPGNNVFVAWQPSGGGMPSELKTAIVPRNRIRYLLRLSEGMVLRRPRGV